MPGGRELGYSTGVNTTPAIRILSDHVANKIAAGEVVERPASVVKELLENALDAGADQVDIDVVDGGRQSLAVVDNGRGMDRDSALLALERHATSKIRDVDDIEKVATMGFRGEALPAIASVSRFTLTTRTHHALEGTECVVNGGTVEEVTATGCPPGTSIRVRNLFYNVPARRKFLRTGPTELAQIRQVFLVYAVAHPEVGMRLTVDGRFAYELPGGATLEERLSELYGRNFVGGLRAVRREQNDLRIHGLAGLPRVQRKDRMEQYLFINGRPARAPALNVAIAEAYRGLMPRDRFPVLFLHLEIDPGLVDVNVHPAKKEIRFRKPAPVREALEAALREALATDSVPDPAPADDPAPRQPPEPVLRITDLPEAPMFPYPAVPLVPDGATRAPDLFPGRDPGGEEEDATADAHAPWAWCRVLGQVGGLYVALETEEGLVLMDPQAAHERVLYERMTARAGQGPTPGQGLLAPETVALPPRDADLVRVHRALLQEMGFGVEEFGGDSFLVDAVPACLGQTAPSELLADIARGFDEGRKQKNHGLREQIARAAARATVRSRSRLSLAEIEQLVVDLARAEMPYTSPAGRPTLILTSLAELHRKFGR